MNNTKELEKIIKQKAEIIKQTFIDKATRKLRSGGFDTTSAELNHGNEGTGPIAASTLSEMATEESSMLSRTGKRSAKNLDCF